MTEIDLTDRLLELRSHHITFASGALGMLGDGYDQMQALSPHWTVLSSWGRDGWDLGDWPYVALYVATVAVTEDDPHTPIAPGVQAITEPGFYLLQVEEGDVDLYRFDTREERDAGIDTLAEFYWQATGRGPGPEVPDQHRRGPWSRDRMNDPIGPQA